MATPTQKISPQQLNALQRNAVLSSSVNMIQQIYSQTLTPATTPVIQLQPRNVGFIKRFIVEFTASVTNTDAATDATLTDFGLANFFSNIQFTDLNNNQRINTTGWHLSFLNTIRHRKPYATGFAPLENFTAVTYADQMSKYGNNFKVVQAPGTVVHGSGPQTIQGYLDIPLTYSDDDLRGGIYANVVNAVMQLQLSFNPAPFVATGADSTNAVYHGPVAASMAFSNVQVSIYQEYLDQLPQGQAGVILPNLDISTVYELKYSQFQNIPSGQDFPVQFANFRDFLSTFAVFNHDTTADAGRGIGADINYWALQAANFTNFWKLDPITQTLQTRNILSLDYPPGTYYQSYRRKPISTVQYGNVELVLNAKTSTVNSVLFVAWEDFALINTLTQAGSLAAGG